MGKIPAVVAPYTNPLATREQGKGKITRRNLNTVFPLCNFYLHNLTSHILQRITMYIRKERFKEEKRKKKKRKREREITTLGSSDISQGRSWVSVVVGAYRLQSLSPFVEFRTCCLPRVGEHCYARADVLLEASGSGSEVPRVSGGLPAPSLVKTEG